MSANESPPGPADQHGSSGQPSSVAPSQPQVLTTAPAQTISEYPISTVNGTVSYISRGVQTPDDWMLPVARAALESAAHSAEVAPVIPGPSTINPVVSSEAVVSPDVAAPPDNRHYCRIDGCSFQSAYAKGVSEHRKNIHLGTVCFWTPPGGSPCGHETATHAELYIHFKTVHLTRDSERVGGRYPCLWPGSPGIRFPHGGAASPQRPCVKTFPTQGNASRCARSHQHDIFVEFENSRAVVEEQ